MLLPSRSEGRCRRRARRAKRDGGEVRPPRQAKCLTARGRRGLCAGPQRREAAGPMSLVPMDDRDGWIWLDGQFTPWREAKVHVLTHALHYGSAVFEGERMYGGEIFKLTEHTERLFKSAEILDFSIPFTVAQIEEASKATCAQNGLDDCYIRPIAWRGSEQMGV